MPIRWSQHSTAGRAVTRGRVRPHLRAQMRGGVKRAMQLRQSGPRDTMRGDASAYHSDGPRHHFDTTQTILPPQLLALGMTAAALLQPSESVAADARRYAAWDMWLQDMSHSARATLQMEVGGLRAIPSQVVRSGGRRAQVAQAFLPAPQFRLRAEGRARLVTAPEVEYVLSLPHAARAEAYASVVTYKDAALAYMQHRSALLTDLDYDILTGQTPPQRHALGAEMRTSVAGRFDWPSRSAALERLLATHHADAGVDIAHVRDALGEWREDYASSRVAGIFDDEVMFFADELASYHIAHVLQRGLRGAVPTDLADRAAWITDEVGSYCAAHCLYSAAAEAMDGNLRAAGYRAVDGYLLRPHEIWLAMPHGSDASRELFRVGESLRQRPVPGESAAHAQLRRLLMGLDTPFGWRALVTMATQEYDLGVVATLVDIAVERNARQARVAVGSLRTYHRAGGTAMAPDRRLLRLQDSLRLLRQSGHTTIASPHVQNEVRAVLVGTL